jgi:hypothetical protein
MNTTAYKYTPGTSVRIIATGVVGKVIGNRDDRDDNVNTLVEWKDGQKQTRNQWCRETELGAPSVTETEAAAEKATGVATGSRADLHESGTAAAATRSPVAGTKGWTPGTAYPLNYRFKDPNGNLQTVVSPGTSQSPNPPTWGQVGARTSDGTTGLVWLASVAEPTEVDG